MGTANPIAAIDTAAVSATRGVPRLEQPKPVDEQAAKLRKLEKAAGDFEAIFLNQLLKPLAKSVSGSSQGSQLGGDVMMEVAVEKMAETLADKGGIGLADILIESLKERVIGDTVPAVPQDDTGTQGDGFIELQEDASPVRIERAPATGIPLDSDKSQTGQVR